MMEAGLSIDWRRKSYKNQKKGHKMLKQFIYAGLGAGVFLKDKVEEELKKLEEKGKIQTTDAKSFMESLEQKGKDEDERLKNSIKSMLKEAIDELGLATKEDIAKLKEELK